MRCGLETGLHSRGLEEEEEEEGEEEEEEEQGAAGGDQRVQQMLGEDVLPKLFAAEASATGQLADGQVRMRHGGAKCFIFL
jgi:hypothetical protein